jgi:MFS family permease
MEQTTLARGVVTAYGLAYGGFLLLGGRAADLLGRRPMIIAGLAVFTTASLGASLAGGLAALGSNANLGPPVRGSG